MKKNDIALRPYYVASVSGGKDSLYMLNVILNNLDKYPLDAVVHFELEIDYPFVKDVINKMEKMCSYIGVKFIRLKPRVKWIDLYNKYGFPHLFNRWCNGDYKLDCQRQLNQFLKSLGYYACMYIGFCADEKKRFKYDIGTFDYNVSRVCYPLAEENIFEKDILLWARNVSLFNDYYKYNDRCGCFYCPFKTYKEFAYMLKYYPNEFDMYFNYVKMHEKKYNRQYYNNMSVDDKIKKIYAFSKGFYQMSIYDFLGGD